MDPLIKLDTSEVSQRSDRGQSEVSQSASTFFPDFYCLTLLLLGFFEGFSLYISEITTLSIFADCVHSIRFVKAILIYTMNPWVLVGCGGLGRAIF